MHPCSTTYLLYFLLFRRVYPLFSIILPDRLLSKHTNTVESLKILKARIDQGHILDNMLWQMKYSDVKTPCVPKETLLLILFGDEKRIVAFMHLLIIRVEMYFIVCQHTICLMISIRFWRILFGNYSSTPEKSRGIVYQSKYN